MATDASGSYVISGQLIDYETQWRSFGLDPRLERSIDKIGWSHPSIIQKLCIPYALKGKDVLAKAKTGSGKTGAYLIPIIQRILTEKESDEPKAGIHALILVPTRELCRQVYDVVSKLVRYCHHIVSYTYIASDLDMDIQQYRLNELPDILISTAGRLVQHLAQKNLTLATLDTLVIDEADLVLSYGHIDDIRKISLYLPKICQGFLTSATLSHDIQVVKNLILHNPIVAKIEENPNFKKQLTQYMIDTDITTRYIQLYLLLKLNIITGKTLIFVNSIRECYKLKLFLDNFSFKTVVLNSSLPHNSRYHIVEEFNRGIFDLLIATDEINDDFSCKNENESNVTIESENASPGIVKATTCGAEDCDNDDDPSDSSKEHQERDLEHANAKVKGKENDRSVVPPLDDIKGSSSDPNALSSDRHMDVLNTAIDAAKMAVMNTDEKSITDSNLKHLTIKLQDISEIAFPEQAKSSGKTTQSSNPTEYGVSRGVDFHMVSNVVNFDFPCSNNAYKHRVGRTARADMEGISISFVMPRDKEIYNQVALVQKQEGYEIQNYTIDSSLINSFRYRTEPFLFKIRKQLIRNIMYEDLKREILNSDKLKSYFRKNPQDLQALTHSRSLSVNKTNANLCFIPDYLLPNSSIATLSPNFPSSYESSENVRSKFKKRSRSNPLTSFQYRSNSRFGSHSNAKRGRRTS